MRVKKAQAGCRTVRSRRFKGDKPFRMRRGSGPSFQDGGKVVEPKLPGKSAKSDIKMKKAKSGTSLGMKSVKAGYDSNPSVTRADIIVAAKKEAKYGSKIKKAQDGVFAPIVAKKSKVDSVMNKRRSALDSSRAAFSKNVQKAKAKLKSPKKMMGGGKCKYGC